MQNTNTDHPPHVAGRTLTLTRLDGLTVGVEL